MPNKVNITFPILPMWEVIISSRGNLGSFKVHFHTISNENNFCITSNYIVSEISGFLDILSLRSDIYQKSFYLFMAQ